MKNINLLKVATLAAFFFTTKLVNSQEAEVKKFVDTKKDFTTDKTGWKKGGFANTNFTNVGLSNWAAGGQSSVSVALVGNLFAVYKDSNQVWETYMDAAWGTIRNGERKINDITNPFFKNEDKLIILSKYGKRINTKLNYTGLAEFKSQFLPGFLPFDPSTGNRGQHVSNFLAPAFGLTSVGFDYKPKDFISFYLSPLTGKFTLVNEQRLADQGAFGVKAADRDANGDIIAGTGQKFRPELGWYANIMFAKNVMENVNVRSRVDLFTNYQTPKLTDINWETTINMKVNKYITASIFAHLIYDDDIDLNPENPLKREPGIQFKHVLGIGLSYMFGDRL
jgi:hypothetical protein